MRKIKAAVVGFGDRGSIYAGYALKEKDQLEIVAVVDPNPFKREKAQKLHNLPAEALFPSLDEFFKADVKADIVIVATMDQIHFETTIPLLEHKYNVLVEKPVSAKKEEMLAIREKAKENGCEVFVCHVLRYTPFYRFIKKLILDGKIGDIMSMEMNEHVCLPHYLTAYDRGKWNSEEKCGSPFLLAKCCHDMDLITWLNNKTEPVKVASFAHRKEFIKENKPSDATEYCYQCPHKDKCPYDAGRLYLTFNAMPFLTWDRLNKPLDEITKDEKEEFLKHDIYGKCAYDCGGDLVDRQNLIIDFKDGSVAAFTMVSDTTVPNRYIHIVGNRGEIEGKIEQNKVVLRTFAYDKFMGNEEIFDLTDQIAKGSGHSGGDYAIMHDLVAYLNGDHSSISITSIDDSVNGHLLVYAAEKSRKNGTIEPIR